MIPPFIRKASARDLAVIYSLILDATRRGKILRRTKSELRRSLRHFWIAEKDGKVCACCSLEVYSKKLAEIRSLVVAKNQEGQGIASALLDHCLGEAKKRKIYEVLVITDRERLFKRKGFSEQLHGQKALFLRPLPQNK